MRRFAWLTDIHLNFLPPEQVAEFFRQVDGAAADGVLLTGDVSDARGVTARLEEMAAAVTAPIYFVLGNHDFYHGSIREVRRSVGQLCSRLANLHYLTGAEPIELAPGLGLIGHDGWADARVGDYDNSNVMLNDYRLIAELAAMTKRQRRGVLEALGDEAAAEIARVLPAALGRFERVILLTHLPPLREACWHEGKISDDEWSPHFTCKAIGDVLLATMPEYPDRQLSVYCGHTHSSGEVRPLPNLTVFTGEATYGQPKIQHTIEIG